MSLQLGMNQPIRQAILHDRNSAAARTKWLQKEHHIQKPCQLWNIADHMLCCITLPIAHRPIAALWVFFFPSATERAQCASCLVSISPAPHLTDDRRAFFLKPSLSPNKSSKNKSLFTAAACKPTSQYWNISMQIGKQFYTLIWRLYFSPAAIAVTANFNKGNFILNLLYRSINKS